MSMEPDDDAVVDNLNAQRKPWSAPRLDDEVREAWKRGEPAACNNCGATPDDWVCEPDHCHGCMAGA